MGDAVNIANNEGFLAAIPSVLTSWAGMSIVGRVCNLPHTLLVKEQK